MRSSPQPEAPRETNLVSLPFAFWLLFLSSPIEFVKQAWLRPKVTHLYLLMYSLFQKKGHIEIQHLFEVLVKQDLSIKKVWNNQRRIVYPH